MVATRSWDIGGFDAVAAKDGGYGVLIAGTANGIGRLAVAAKILYII